MPEILSDNNASTVRTIIGQPFEWCAVPGGEFLYGDKKQKLTLPPFQIAKYLVTYQQFQVFIDADDGYADSRWWEGLAVWRLTHNTLDDRGVHDQYWAQPFGNAPHSLSRQEFKVDDHPRERVSWYEAVAFCRWLSFRLGGLYDLDSVGKWLVRLPTEFEWEKAARGIDGRDYPYRGRFDPRKSNTRESKIGRTTPVTHYPNGASPYGVFDMSGNVLQWCLTDFLNPNPDITKEDMRSDTRRCLRGGSWFNDSVAARAAARTYNDPYSLTDYRGFRICASIPV